jgi:SNF2 family DNA or RNA helicase
LQRVSQAAQNKIVPAASKSVEPAERLVYILSEMYGQVKVELSVMKALKKGGYGQPRAYQLSNLLSHQAFPAFVRPLDVQLGRKILLAQPSLNTYDVRLANAAGAELLPELLATGRCHWRGAGKKSRPLAPGAARPAKPVWNIDEKGCQRPTFQIDPPAARVLPVSPPWFVDDTNGECGPIETNLPPDVAAAWLSAPPVSPEDAQIVATEFAGRQSQFALPSPRPVEIEERARVEPAPCLRLYSTRLKNRFYNYGWAPDDDGERDREQSFARLDFDYAGVRVEPHGANHLLENYSDGKLRRMRRDPAAENKALHHLTKIGLQPAKYVVTDVNLGSHADAYTFSKEEKWLDFVHIGVPKLRSQGWQVELDPDFQFHLVEADDWFTDAVAEAGGNDWFGVELGVVVAGEKVNLLPVLLQVLQTNPALLQEAGSARMSDKAVIPVPLPDGRKVMFPAGRARQMLGALLELLNPGSLNERGQLRLPKLRALELAGEADWRWLGAAELRELGVRLRNFSGVKPVIPPANLHAVLRPYQQDGLNWLQFLREYELAGVLADDMGLGKTVQALAHLLVEKQSGRMDCPSLVIAPTSLMTNWRQEAERFAPDLRVLLLHGADRQQHFDRIAGHDLIITSYPLLPRDHAVLCGQQFHCVILDEAQFIKNPKTQYARVACALKARHHLCLTGTPMENHLGELWSLFHFLLPGFLGDEKRFNGVFRRPIEKGNNDDRRKLLARRLSPFILRRKKAEVATELPPKTEIIQHLELTGGQRDLYESVRLAMHQRVKEEVANKGLSRSHIVILDALLKLRQICCHPRLLSLPSAQKVKESAKLELLLDLLPEMIAEGRRILLFSQFTSMLAIIQTELAALKIPYVLLTGETRDRATPVASFQKGEAPLFLISLKAGGTGLNLTAADTVIHYDPWWNPAVENQATDRAHRIGQNKNVFVYKLLTAGTVEEKIAAMQARKRELVEGLLNEQRPENLKLAAEDLDVLFAPLPGS